jgi:hypothetical protein
MYNDSLFNAFARSYEARSETDMSMAEYLESCRGRSDAICKCGRAAPSCDR